MLILLSCAKMMRLVPEAACAMSEPRFAATSQRIREAILAAGTEDLARQLKLKPAAAEKVWASYHQPAAPSPALLAYEGVAFRSFWQHSFGDKDWEEAQSHLRICSFYHGLLRPCDGIAPYRLEANYKLGDQPLLPLWREQLTESLLADARAAGGLLCHLASKEMESLFDWKRIQQELHIITPQFSVEHEGRVKNISTRSKQGRGAMASWIIRQRIRDAKDLRRFDEAGWRYQLESPLDRPEFRA